MGNNQSQQAPPPQTEVVRRPPTRPNAPPSARPLSDLGPKGPSYHSPENMVLPKDIPVLRLRPVSMELSKFHPEFKEMFNHGDEDEKENMGDIDDDADDDEASKLEKLGTSPPRPPPPILKNGNIPNTSVKANGHVAPHVSNNQMANGHVNTGTVNNSVNNNITPANTGTNGKGNVPYRPSHRRQISLGQEHNIIMEEPEENIDNRFKLDPLMQSFPGATGPSLPVKNNFNLDYSYQLTYVQLAEHRRNKTIEELEKRTGKKLSDLSADLNENQDQPFKRAAPSRISSQSTGSGGSALSSKKKKAPEPPGANTTGAPKAPPPPLIGVSNTLPLPSKLKTKASSQPYSIENEPPADYEMDSPRREVNVVLPRYKPVSRNNSTRSATPAAPPTPPALSGSGSSPRKSAPVSRNNSLSMGKPEIILKKTPSVKPAQKEPCSADTQVPWLLEIKNMSESMSARRQQSVEKSDTPETVKEKDMDTNEDETKETESVQEKVITSSQTKMIYETSNSDFKAEIKQGKEKNVTKEEESKTEEIVSSTEKDRKPASPKLARHASTLGFQETSTPTFQRQISEPSSLANQTDPVRRLSSLLQHDIKAAANAKCHKLKKQVTPVPPKPKDPHEVFREQLAKACAQRDERVAVEGTIDDKLSINEKESAKVGKVKDKEEQRKDSTTSSEPPETLPKPPRYHKNVTMNRKTASYDRRQNVQNIPVENRASTALDWTPEDDLDSDDNLSDRDTHTSRKTSSDGFKSTIIPQSVSDLKTKKKSKKEKKPKTLGEDENNKQKFGSVKKIKKSMHRSVKNAFGSISKASGRILRRQRAEDIEQVDDAPKIWKLSREEAKSNKSKTSERAKKYMVQNGYGDSDSESEKMNGNDHEFTERVKQNGHNDSEENSSEDSDSVDHNMYRSKSSDVNLSAKRLNSREQKYVYDSDEEMEMAKYKEKKKMQMYKASVKEELEKEREEATKRAIQEARERERKLEAERRKQLEMELELHKIREAETRERLQRLENAHLQQQLSAHLLQQQQQNMSMQISAPPLPPAGNFNQSYGLGQETAQSQTFANLFGSQLPQNGYQTNFGLYHPTQTGPMLNGTVPSMNYDINDYMRMLGVQTPPTSQQMAYFLNSMTLTGQQPFDRKSNPTIIEMINQQDPVKQYNTGHMNYQLTDPTTKKQGFQNWANSPNLNLTSTVPTAVPMSDFVTSYSTLNGANTQSDSKDKSQKSNSRNPLYTSDDSDEGLSPHRTVVRANTKEFRKLPARTESGKFMRQYGSYISKATDSSKPNDHSDQQLSDGLSQENIGSQREDSVSPSNSMSTFDSAITSPSVSLSTPSSPSRSVEAPASPMVIQRGDASSGFRTILDLTSAGSKTQITMIDGSSYNS